MSSRKRPLAEISQPNSTPSRYAPSTPHAIRALQQRSGAKTRSAKSIRPLSTDVVRPDSIRGVLRQFAKISAPVTQKRIVTPNSIVGDKENREANHDLDEGDENDSILLKRPNLTFAIEESIEEENSELPAAPTPSVLPDDEDYEQPTVTFHNVRKLPTADPASERSDRRRSRMSLIHSEPLQGEEIGDQEADVTMLTERGRRAISEEMTGRLSRYSFGSIRMSEFGSELEIQRESDRYEKPILTNFTEFVPVGEDFSLNGDDTEALPKSPLSPSEIYDDTVQLPTMEDETFRLEFPGDLDVVATANEANESIPIQRPTELPKAGLDNQYDNSSEMEESIAQDGSSLRPQTLLETAAKSQRSQRKRVKMTCHGTTVPSLPTSLIRRVVLDSYEKQSKRKPILGRDHMKALEQASEWFFEQVGDDLAAYSTHGRRKKRINTDDVLLMMKRQKVLPEIGELRSLAKGWIPKDVLSELELSDIV